MQGKNTQYASESSTQYPSLRLSVTTLIKKFYRKILTLQIKKTQLSMPLLLWYLRTINWIKLEYYFIHLKPEFNNFEK